MFMTVHNISILVAPINLALMYRLSIIESSDDFCDDPK